MSARRAPLSAGLSKGGPGLIKIEKGRHTNRPAISGLTWQTRRESRRGLDDAMTQSAHTMALFVGLTVLAARPVHAQQFNSDSYLSKPAGTITIILTTGQRNQMMMTTFSLLPKWEFTSSIFIYNSDNDPTTDDGYSSSFYAKYMIFENAAKTGGFAVKFGTGLEPGYLNADNRVEDAFKSYWANAPVTLPFLDNKLSLDVMPGLNSRVESDQDDSAVWNFTYATRLAWYPTTPKWSIVGEIIGAEGKGTSPPEYRVGWRWEPNQHAVFAVTYDNEFGGTDNGAKWEVGMMLFTPPFFCIRGC
jgi:hypothetical protein